VQETDKLRSRGQKGLRVFFYAIMAQELRSQMKNSRSAENGTCSNGGNGLKKYLEKWNSYGKCRKTCPLKNRQDHDSRTDLQNQCLQF